MTALAVRNLLPTAPPIEQFPLTPPYPINDLDCHSFMDEAIPAQTNPIITTTVLPTTPTSIISTSNLTSAQGSPSFLKPTASPKQGANLSSIATASLQTSPHSPPKPRIPSRLSPQPMTAAAAFHEQREQKEGKQMIDARMTSPNPARNALSSLMGVQDGAISNAKDAPAASTTLSEPLAAVSESLQISDELGDIQQQTSPVSLSSFGTGEITGTAPNALTSTILPTSMPAVSPVQTRPVASPGSMEDRDIIDGDMTPKRKATDEPSSERRTGAFSYPGPLVGLGSSGDPRRRDVSLPHSGLRQGSPRSPSTKKHKCPYCSTEFTRHHNLKSHLLTHSQEKPYVCQTCQSRFRRLHDLKRHTKLHTGERPHICPKCGRRFARGDALARHNKGQGGCAGRRSSMGSFGGDDDYQEGDDSMDGLVYTNEPEHMEDEDDDRRRQSLPSIKKHEPSDPNQHASPRSSGHQSRQPSTYPPIAAGRQPGLFPPAASHGGSSSSTSPGSNSGATYPPSGQSNFTSGSGPVFQQAGITESPKPLSPGAAATHQLGHGHGHDTGLHRNRSPSLTQQFQQQRFGRRTPPLGSLSHPPLNPPQLPPPAGLNPPDPRYTLPSQGPSTLSGHPARMSTGELSSHNNSLSSHGQPSHGGQVSGDAYQQASDQQQIWVYLRALENKVNGLQDEVSSLRAQLSAATSQAPSHSLNR